MLLFHGTEDRRVAAQNSQQLAQQFLGFWDLVDDKKINQSARFVKTVSYHQNSQFPAELSKYENNAVTLEVVLVSNLAHRWSGGSHLSPYGEPESFNATAYSLSRFLDISRRKK